MPKDLKDKKLEETFEKVSPNPFKTSKQSRSARLCKKRLFHETFAKWHIHFAVILDSGDLFHEYARIFDAEQEDDDDACSESTLGGVGEAMRQKDRKDAGKCFCSRVYEQNSFTSFLSIKEVSFVL